MPDPQYPPLSSLWQGMPGSEVYPPAPAGNRPYNPVGQTVASLTAPMRRLAAVPHNARLEDATVKRSTPTTPQHSESSQPDVPQGRLSPRNYAPHLSDPDPDPEPMTDEEIKSFARKVVEHLRSQK
jgi:hypothetical protein